MKIKKKLLAILGTIILTVLLAAPVFGAYDAVSLPVGVSVEGEEGTIVLTDENGVELERKTFTGDESFTLSADEPGTYIYKIFQEQTEENNLMDASCYTVYFVVTEEDGVLLPAVALQIGDDAEKPANVCFTNGKEEPDPTPEPTPEPTTKPTPEPVTPTPTVQPPKQEGPTPLTANPAPSTDKIGEVKTGDTSRPLIYIGAGITAVAMLVLIIVFIKRNKRNR